MVRTWDVSQSKRAVFMISATDAAQGTQVEIITVKIVYIFPHNLTNGGKRLLKILNSPFLYKFSG